MKTRALQYFFRYTRRTAVNLLLFAAVFTACIAITDLVLYLTSSARIPLCKTFAQTYQGQGVFYYRRNLSDMVPPEGRIHRVEDYASLPGTRLVLYNEEQKRKGFYPNRPQKAVLVGDSFTLGEGVENRDSLGWILGREYPEYNFCNFGWSGQNFYDTLQTAREASKEPGIGHILYFYNLNDLIGNEAWPENMGTDLQNSNPETGMLTKGLLAKSTLAALLSRALAMRKHTRITSDFYLDYYLGGRHEKDFTAALDTLADFDRGLRKRGIRLHVIIYPLIHKTLISGRYPFQPIHDKLMGSLRSRDIDCVDAAGALAKLHRAAGLMVNSVDFHPNGRANRLVAAFVRKKLEL